jgi:Zn-dependent protease with chaperone function
VTTSSYALRLVCLSLAVLFLVHAAVELAVAICAPAMLRRAERWRAAAAAQTMLALRLLPAASALFVMFAICIPSYLRLEPAATEEDIGIACLALAAMGAAMWGFSIARTARALLRSMRHLRAWRRRGSEATIGDRRVWMVDGSGQTLALAGIFRPKLIVSRNIVETLPADQLAAALRHERAHADAWDNSKRLLMFLGPLRRVVRRRSRGGRRRESIGVAGRGPGQRGPYGILIGAAAGHCADGEFGGFAGESGTAAPGTQ